MAPTKGQGMDEATREAIYAAMEEALRDPQKLAEGLEHFHADVQFALDHTEEWRHMYPDHWIAVYDCELIAVEPTEDLLRTAAKKKSVPLAHAYVDFLLKEKPVLML
jgi:hypothetical protein